MNPTKREHQHGRQLVRSRTNRPASGRAAFRKAASWELLECLNHLINLQPLRLDERPDFGRSQSPVLARFGSWSAWKRRHVRPLSACPRRSDLAETCGQGDGMGAIARAEPSIGLREVAVGGMLGDSELIGDLGGGLALLGLGQTFTLTRREKVTSGHSVTPAT